MSFREPRWNAVTAVFGGTFDPPHLGHIEAFQGLLKDPGVKSVLVIPAQIPPHKPAVASIEQRFEMAKTAFGPSNVSDLELRRKGPSYTFDTLQELQPRFGRELAFVIGTDQLEKLHTWHRFPEVLHQSHWLVLSRKGFSEPQKTLETLRGSGILEKFTDSLWAVKGSDRALKVIVTPAREVSSSNLRLEIGRHGRVPEGVISREIESYLKTHRIYGTEGDDES